MNGRRACTAPGRALAALTLLMVLAAAPAGARADSTGHIRGRVTDDRAYSVGGACVTAYNYRGGRDRVAGTARTKGNGRYRMRVVSHGFSSFASYTLYFEGCTKKTAKYPAHYAETTRGRFRGYVRSVEVADGKSATVDTMLAPAASISGHVRAAGKPLPHAKVLLRRRGAREFHVAGRTGRNGGYRLRHMREGDYKVRFAHPGGGLSPEYFRNAFEQSKGKFVTLVPRGHKGGISASLVRAGKIRGIVKDDSGDPVFAVPITLEIGREARHGYVEQTTASDSTGHYSFDSVPPGRYRLKFGRKYPPGLFGGYFNDRGLFHNNADVIHVGTGKTVTANGILRRSGLISGQVKDGMGNPISDACVAPYAPGLSKIPWDIESGDDPPEATRADDNGNYTIFTQGLNDVVLYASECYYGQDSTIAGQYYPGTGSYFDATPVHVDPGGSTTGIDFQLPVGGSVSGRITDSHGDPIKGAYAVAYGVPLTKRENGLTRPSAKTDANGEYTIRPLRSLDIKIRFITNGYTFGPYQSHFYGGGHSESSGSPIHVAVENETSGIDATLPKSNGCKHADKLVSDAAKKLKAAKSARGNARAVLAFAKKKHSAVLIRRAQALLVKAKLRAVIAGYGLDGVKSSRKICRQTFGG